ncbi:uncharacterized protein LOC143295224 [Babylonia areolata]|uniref:uncharacterized protein LOC143295224 n=1 Tax=Babylonia areolata TaxID=304850 RepID=UPI003FD27601
MGCGNSKTVRVQPMGPPPDSAPGKEGCTQTVPETEQKHCGAPTKDSDSAAEYELDEHGNKVKSRTDKRRPGSNKDIRSPMGSCDTLEEDRSQGSERGFSAASKQSKDSGLGEDHAHDRDESDTQKTGKPATNDLEPLRVTSAPKDRLGTRVDEAQIMRGLREEGLISRPQLQSSGGMCFEIVAAEDGVKDRGVGVGMPKPPPRLEKLAVERGKKKRRVLTEDQIREKLERAEQRRKRREQERLAKLREMERTDAVAALDNFVQYQKNKEEMIAQRMDQVLDNRERKLQEVKEKQERRKKHAEEVRKRKALAAAVGAENGASHDLSLEDDLMVRKMTPRPEMTMCPEVVRTTEQH